MISIPAIVRETRRKIDGGSYSIITELCGSDLSRLDIEMVIYAFLHDDMMVCQIIKDMASKLSFGIRNIFSMFHPQEVVIRGNRPQVLGNGFLKCWSNIRRIILLGILYETKIRYTQIQEFGANLGMAKYYLDSVMSLTETKRYRNAR